MCGKGSVIKLKATGTRSIPVSQTVGMALEHDITEIRKDAFKSLSFKKVT